MVVRISDEALCSALAANSEDSLVRIIGDMLWRLAVLHELGYVHNDVKPSNILQDGNDVLLCDFGNAAKGIGEGLSGATEGFRVIPGLFQAGPYQCDLEGLYWTVLSMWLGVRKGSSRWPQLLVLERKEKFGLFAFAESPGDEGVPTNIVLFAYLCGQAKARKLTNPLQFLKNLGPAKNWIERTLKRIETEGLPHCPRPILEWFCKRWKREALPEPQVQRGTKPKRKNRNRGKK